MFDNINHYTLRIEEVNGIAHYYVSFIDGQALSQEIEVTHSVYLEFCRFTKLERNLRRSDERHIEQSDLSDEMLNKRAIYPQKDIEDIVSNRELAEVLSFAIGELPEVQRRRFVLYYYNELTYEQIAKLEKCSKMPIKRSIDRAKEKILERIKKFKK